MHLDEFRLTINSRHPEGPLGPTHTSNIAPERRSQLHTGGAATHHTRACTLVIAQSHCALARKHRRKAGGTIPHAVHVPSPRSNDN